MPYDKKPPRRDGDERRESVGYEDADGLIEGMRTYMMCTTLRKARSNASLCVKCGKCEQHCPQSLSIREELDGVKRRFENPVYKIAAKFSPLFMKY